VGWHPNFSFRFTTELNEKSQPIERGWALQFPLHFPPAVKRLESRPLIGGYSLRLLESPIFID
jgi:hypothetical protein